MSGDQLELPLAASTEPQLAVEYLTIAEAARRVRCCERTIRRAIDSGVLRAGRVHGGHGSRGGFGSGRAISRPGCTAMARKGSEPAISERSYRLADGSLSQTYSVRYFDRGVVRRRVACASREEADFHRARIVLEQTRGFVADAAPVSDGSARSRWRSSGRRGWPMRAPG